MDPNRNRQEIPPAMGYHPATGTHSGGGGAPPLPPPYITNNPSKYPPYRTRPPPAGRYPAPLPLVESRYPPASSARHEDYSRHPPPTHSGPPPPAHYNGNFPGSPPPTSEAALPPATPPAVTPATSKPHPADKFGKTITVSNRTSISDPLSFGPAPLHSPRPSLKGHHGGTAHHPAVRALASSRGPAPLRAVTLLHTAPMARSDAVQFSPSKRGAFLPYRPAERRHCRQRYDSPPPNPRQVKAQSPARLRPNARVEIFGISAEDKESVPALIKAAEKLDGASSDAAADGDGTIAEGNGEDEGKADPDIAKLKEANEAKKEKDEDDKRMKEAASGDNEAKGSMIDGAEGQEGSVDEVALATIAIVEGEVRNIEHGEHESPPISPSNRDEVGTEKQGQGPGTTVSKSTSMESSEPASSRDRGADIAANKGSIVHETGDGKGRPKPTPISTNNLKRPRSAPWLDSKGESVNVDDDTPKHINISHDTHGDGGSAFCYPDSKRSRCSVYPPLDLSQVHQHSHSSYSIESEEERQDQPTTPGRARGFSHRQPYHEGGYFYHHDEQYPGAVLSQAPSQSSHPGHRRATGDPVLSQDPSQGSHGGILSSASGGGGVHGSWTTPDGSEYPEPANYLNSRSMSWEVPAGTLSAIGSTLSFGGIGATPIAGVTPGATHGVTLATPGAFAESGSEMGQDFDSAALGAGRDGKGKVDEDDEEDDDIPPLPSTGSNLPPRKRALLAPRPSGPSSKLFEPPRPAPQPRSASSGGTAGCGGRGTRAVEARDPREGSRHTPHTVHYPHGENRRRTQAYPHPHTRRDHHPSTARPYSYGHHGEHQRCYGEHLGGYDDRYDPQYGSPRVHGIHHGHHLGNHQGSHHQGSRYSDQREYRDHRRDPYQTPARHPEYAPSHALSSHHGSQPPPWGSPPHTSSGRHAHHHRRSPPNDAPGSTPGGNSSNEGGDCRSFDSSLSRRSFRSLDDLEEPMASLLYRPSFSWERGLEVPYSSSNFAHPSSSHHHSGPHGNGNHGGPHYSTHGPPPPLGHPPHHPGYPPADGGNGDGMIQLRDQQKIMKALTMRNEIRTIGNPNSAVGLILLLAMPQDRHCLSETLCIVRNNVEIFTATEEDINAPAPGRKRPIQVGQVGLRCVYCRMCPQRDRVKRATCFPSSMKRIYRAVIDMKLDHFKNCPYVPPGLKARLDQLQAGSTRSTGMTVQYFVKSAKEVGMVDVEEGVTINLKRVGVNGDDRVGVTEELMIDRIESDLSRMGGGGVNKGQEQHALPYAQRHHHQGQAYIFSKQRGRGTRELPVGFTHQGSTSGDDVAPSSPPGCSGAPFRSTGIEMAADPQRQAMPGMPERQYSGQVLLTLPDDENFLSPLRCFLRRHVCAFTATARDIAVRTPTTFSVRVGQVGVGCIHCLSVPPKQRSNRAVCFPFTVARIYQSVADIQRFHLGECRMMPPEVRAEFLRLQSESAKGSRGLATRTYWIDSAKKIGLADGPAGMYFHRDPSLPPSPTTTQDTDGSLGRDGDSLNILAQVASNNDAAERTHPLVTPEDRPTIAEFLYLVMEQLRPCRFTDADRNKRRSKDVGSIGVECRHCAGKIDGRKFFWSSVSAAESNFVSVHSHMLGCKYIPEDLRTELARLKSLRREQTSRLKTGSQKAFFTRVWARLHGEPVPSPGSAAKAALSLKVKGGSSKSGRQIHDPNRRQMPKGVIIEAPPKGGENPEGATTAPAVDEPATTPDLQTGKSHDSDEIRALLESKSTLSSMPSVDDASILKHAKSLEIDLITGRSHSSDGEMKAGRSDESGGEGGSKGSGVTSVALNLSAVSVHCKEERKRNDQQKRAEVP